MVADLERPGTPLPGDARPGGRRASGRARSRPRRSARTWSAHYAEAGRWEWEQFLAPDAVTEWERRRYFEVI